MAHQGVEIVEWMVGRRGLATACPTLRRHSLDLDEQRRPVLAVREAPPAANTDSRAFVCAKKPSFSGACQKSKRLPTGF
jgi:hypothetical protein